MNLVHNSHLHQHKQYLHPVANLKLRSLSYYLSQSQNIHYVFPALFAWLLRFWGFVCIFFLWPQSKNLVRSPTQAQEETPSELPGWFPTLLLAAVLCCLLASYSSLRSKKIVHPLSPIPTPANPQILFSEAKGHPATASMYNLNRRDRKYLSICQVSDLRVKCKRCTH